MKINDLIKDVERGGDFGMKNTVAILKSIKRLEKSLRDNNKEIAKQIRYFLQELSEAEKFVKEYKSERGYKNGNKTRKD